MSDDNGNFSEGDHISGEQSSDETEMNSEIFSVYILKSNPSVLAQAESYLRNRGCVVGSGSGLKEALAYIIQKQPQFVLLSADHPNKKVKILPKLITQAFPVKVIGFSERNSSLSVKSLTDMNLEYVLYSPVSGPSIQRLIRKMKKDEELKLKQAEANKNNPDSATLNNNSAITFKGDNSARDAINQLLSNNDDPQDQGYYLDKGSALKTGPAYNAEQEGSIKNPSHYNPQEQQPGESFEAWAERMREEEKSAKQEGVNSPELSARSSTPTGKDNSAKQGSEQQAGESFDAWAERMRKEAEKPNRAAKQDPKHTQTENSQAEDEEQSDWQGNTPKGTPILESDYKRKEKKNYTFHTPRPTSFQKSESLIVKGTESALDETVKITGEKDKASELVDKSSNIACITVESPRFSGYLVCALGHNRKIDEELIKTIKQRLFDFLRSNGEQVSPDDTMNLKLEEVEFEDWAVEQADFLKKSVHDGSEIAMAFFPSKDMKFSLEDSASEKMLKMTIDEFKSDTPIEFDLYIYMPENRKYLLYTPQGMNFYGNQKDRLMQKGVTHLHLKKDSASQVKKYRAQNYLNEKIEAFKTASKLKKSGSTKG